MEVRSARFVRKGRGFYCMYVVSIHMLRQGHTKFLASHKKRSGLPIQAVMRERERERWRELYEMGESVL